MRRGEELGRRAGEEEGEGKGRGEGKNSLRIDKMKLRF